MNKTQLEHLMNKTQLYHEAYLKAYSQSDNSSKTEGSSKNVLPFLIFILGFENIKFKHEDIKYLCVVKNMN